MLAFYGVVHGVACPAEEPHAEAGRVAMDSVFTSLFLFFFFLLLVSVDVFALVMLFFLLLEKRTRTGT